MKNVISYFTFQEEVNPTFAHICAEQGMRTLLEHLYAYYNKRTPVSRILCFTIDTNSRLVIPSEDVNYSTSILPNPYKGIHELFDLSDSPNYEDEAKVYYFQANNPLCKDFLEFLDPRHKSALILLVHSDSKEFYTYIQVCSDDENAFNLDAAKILVQTRMPLRLAIEKKYYTFSLRSETLQEPTTDPLSQLYMCEDLKPVMKRVEYLAPSNKHITIMGETGVGKEIFADAIHALSKRSNAPLIKINCGAINENLADSELFGYERGAFTGAINTHAGYFEQADGGTLFLDEVGELSPANQVRLLRVLDRGEIRRVGGMRTLKVNVRVLAATHRNLEKEIEENRFREDLWYRLCVYPIQIPPLRERLDDVATLIKYFIGIKAKAIGITPVPLLETLEFYSLVHHSWQGNVRQLEHVIEHALLEHEAYGGGKFLKINFLPSFSQSPKLKADEMFKHITSLNQMNKMYIEHILAKCKGKISGKNGAAHLLDIPVSTLRAKMSKLNIIMKSEKE